MPITAKAKKKKKKARTRKKKVSKVDSAAKLKLKAASQLLKMFKSYIRPGREPDKPDPFAMIDSAIVELKSVSDAKTKKLYKLYTARKIKTGLCDLFRDIQRTAARARTVVDNLVNMAVQEHSKLLKGEQKTVGRSIPIPTERDIIADIDAIEKYFGNWTVTRDGISVQTKDIELSYNGDSFNFGPFKITLLFRGGLRRNQRYRLEPLEPHIVDGYSHPHVDGGGYMCEGEATEPLTHALGNGLLHEFFMIVHNTLTNYNHHSPFIGIEAWFDGEENGGYQYHCNICGAGMNEDDYYYCEDCDTHVCDGCSTYCDSAGVSICENCIGNYRRRGSGCPGCDDVGGRECCVRQNPPCAVCGSVLPDNDIARCEATSLVFCKACIDFNASEETPCHRDWAVKIFNREAVRKMGRRKDGICTLVCKNTRADSTETAKCLLRQRKYVHAPDKADNGGSGGPK